MAIYAVSDDYSGQSLTNPLIPEKYKKVNHSKVTIGKHVIIGSGCTVLPGVDLKEGSAFGAMTLINKDAEPWSVYAGFPFKKINERRKNLLDLEKNSWRIIKMNNEIQVTQSSMPPLDEYINEIKDLWDSKWLTNMGSKHKQLEKELLDYMKANNVKLYTNGHSGLEIAIQAMNLTGEVITTPYTFSSTTQAIIQNDLVPVFCDINEEDYTMDVTKIEDLITEKTSAIVPVHVYGNICDVEEINRIAKKYNLKVIYDAAHVFGVEYKNQGIGNYGDASMFSFHATKVFNTIEGGAVTYNDERLSETLEALKNFGQTTPESVEYVAGNAKMNEFQAAMGLTNLKYVEEYIAGRKEVAERYDKHLSGVDGIKLSKVQADVKPNYAYYPVVFNGYKFNRDEVQEKLAVEGIHARKYFYPLTSSFAAYEGEYDINDTPVAKHVSEHVLTLPLYPDLALEDVDRICKIILE